MIRGSIAVWCVALAASHAPAQETVRMNWQPGQVLVYRAEHAIQVNETVGDEKSESKSRVNVTKRWQVATVDANGCATLQLTLLRLRNEMTRPDGEVLVFDSADPTKTTPEVREQQARYVGPVLAILRVDSWGRVVEVKESKFGPASRFECELPFVGMLPGAGLKPNATWERSYQITLEPPQGTGEKFAALQRYRCTGVVGNLATIALQTELKAPPAAAADRVPLAQMQPAGEFVFDRKAGRLHSAALKVDQEIKGHQGENSTYRFQSSYSEQYIGDK